MCINYDANTELIPLICWTDASSAKKHKYCCSPQTAYFYARCYSPLNAKRQKHLMSDWGNPLVNAVTDINNEQYTFITVIKSLLTLAQVQVLTDTTSNNVLVHFEMNIHVNACLKSIVDLSAVCNLTCIFHKLHFAHPVFCRPTHLNISGHAPDYYCKYCAVSISLQKIVH